MGWTGYFREGGLVHAVRIGWMAIPLCKPGRVGSMVISQKPVTCKKCLKLMEQAAPPH